MSIVYDYYYYRRDTVNNRLPRSASIDSMVDTVWAETSETVEPLVVPEKRLSVRSERALGLVSPSVGRRMKGQRGVNGKSCFFIFNIVRYVLC